MEVISSSEKASDQSPVDANDDEEEDQSRQRRARDRGCPPRRRLRRRQSVEVFGPGIGGGSNLNGSLHA